MRRSVMLLGAWLAAQGAVAAPNVDSPAALFADDTVLELSLEGPLEATFADREAREERPFLLRLATGEVPLEVRVRGKSRARICTFAPLRLDFQSEHPAGTPLAGQDKLKLVLPCHDTDRAELDVIEEYAVYRIFNVLSDVSYRVRLLRIRFVDTDAPGETPLMERHAFLLESHDELSMRTRLPQAAVAAVRRSELAADQAASVFIFQYLVGNTDWSLVSAEEETYCCHNVRLFGASPPFYPVPYDFDLTGLVDARYAEPDASMRLRDVTQRRYRGYCIDPEALESALGRTKARRDAILSVPRSLPLLSEKQIESRVRYLEDFFERAGNETRLLERFNKKCL